jgi:hypothetical protein
MEYFRDYLARVIVHMLNKHGKKAAEDDPAAQQVQTSTPHLVVVFAHECPTPPFVLNKDDGKPYSRE